MMVMVMVMVTVRRADLIDRILFSLQTSSRHAVLPVRPALWPGSLLSAVRLGYGAPA